MPRTQWMLALVIYVCLFYRWSLTLSNSYSQLKAIRHTFLYSFFFLWRGIGTCLLILSDYLHTQARLLQAAQLLMDRWFLYPCCSTRDSHVCDVLPGDSSNPIPGLLSPFLLHVSALCVCEQWFFSSPFSSLLGGSLFLRSPSTCLPKLSDAPPEGAWLVVPSCDFRHYEWVFLGS